MTRTPATRRPTPAATTGTPSGRRRERCGAVAFAGGPGVAPGYGAIYFLSPERLDGASGVQNEPNLYLSEPGQAPRFVATLEPSNPAIADAVLDSDEGRLRRLPGDAERRLRGLRLGLPADRVPERRHTGDLPLRRPGNS